MGWGPILLKNLTTSKNNQTIVYIIIYIHIFIFITIKFLTKPLRVLEDKVNKTNKQQTFNQSQYSDAVNIAKLSAVERYKVEISIIPSYDGVPVGR